MAAEKAQTGRVDLNKATRDELSALPGLSAVVAGAIVKYRDERGGFGEIEELADVPGMKPHTLETLRSHLRLGGKGNGQTARNQEKKTVRSAPRAAEKGAEAGAESAEEAAQAGEQASRRSADVAEQTAERGAEVAEEAGRAGAETLEASRESGAEAMAAGRESAGRAAEQTERVAEQVSDQAKGGAEAMSASTGNVLAGMQELNREWLVYLQEQMQESMDAGRALACCRSPQELVEVQARYARSSWSRFANESTKLANLTFRVMGAGMQPLQARGRESAEEGLRHARR